VNVGELVCVAGIVGGALMATLGLGIARAPGWSVLRWYALVAATAALYCFFDLFSVIDASPETALTMTRLALGAAALHAAAWIVYLARDARRPLSTWDRVALAVDAVVAALSLPPGVLVGATLQRLHIAWLGLTYQNAVPTTLGVAAIAAMCLSAAAAVSTYVRPLRDGWRAQLPAAALLVIAGPGMNDTLVAMGALRGPMLLDLGLLLFVTVSGASHLDHFVSDAHRLESLSTELEARVEARSQELLASQSALDRAERLAGVGRVAAGVAHEVNNPTTAVIANLEMLREVIAATPQATPEAAGWVDESVAAMERIRRLVRQLLASTRGERRDSTRTVAFFVLPAVRAAVTMAKRAAAEDVVMEVAVPEDLACRGDPTMLEQVLLNLVTNAAQACRAHGGTVTVRGRCEGERAVIEVVDDGEGIDARIRERLFEPFATTKPVGEGTGLGLSVSRELMRAQSGELRVAATSAEGTTMALDLPWEPAARVPSRREGGARMPQHVGLRLLLIDDDAAVRVALARSLSRVFFVDAAESVERAVARARQHPRPDLVLCDVQMPDGGARAWLDVCADEFPALARRTLLVTGGSVTGATQVLLDAYVDRLLLKPVDARALVEALLALHTREAAAAQVGAA
jgi:signal transduction histidine kinase/ActR/RegA family two-component response regulator